jgi:hypothetical protein
VRLDDDELWWVLYACSQEQRYRSTGYRGSRRPVSPQLARVIRRLELEVATSRLRQDDVGAVQLSEHEDPLVTRDAAAVLGWTTRKVQRHSADLEGRKTSAGWIFPAAAVHAYAEALTDARDTA